MGVILHPATIKRRFAIGRHSSHFRTLMLRNVHQYYVIACPGAAAELLSIVVKLEEQNKKQKQKKEFKQERDFPGCPIIKEFNSYHCRQKGWRGVEEEDQIQCIPETISRIGKEGRVPWYPPSLWECIITTVIRHQTMTVTGNVKQHGTSYTTTFHMQQNAFG